MARIRTIKPEIWGDEKFGFLDTQSQLVFIGLVSQADDAGRLVDSVRLIDGLIWPYDESRTSRESLRNLWRTGLIERGETASGQSVIQINGWDEHQRVDKPNMKAALPPIESPKPRDDNSLENPRESVENHSRDDRESVAPHTNDQRSTTNDQRSLPPPDGVAISEPSNWQSEDVGAWNGGQVLAAYIEYCERRGWPPPPDSQRKKLGAVCKRLATKNSPRQITMAMVGMGNVYPYSSGETWDPFDLDRKFTKAHAAAVSSDDMQEEAFANAFLRRAG